MAHQVIPGPVLPEAARFAPSAPVSRAGDRANAAGFDVQVDVEVDGVVHAPLISGEMRDGVA